MSAPPRLAGFAAILAVRVRRRRARRRRDRPRRGKTAERRRPLRRADGRRSEAGADHGAAPQAAVRGLAVAENGLRVVVGDAGAAARPHRARCASASSTRAASTVRDFDVEHEKRMHLIVARRDLTGFQHLHPEQAADGSWSTEVRLDAAGSYRLFADFARDGKAMHARDRPARRRRRPTCGRCPRPRRRATSDRRLRRAPRPGDASAGEEAELRFTSPATAGPCGPSPTSAPAATSSRCARAIWPSCTSIPSERRRLVSFEPTFPTAGRYRLFLQFKHEGRVHTVAFTQEVR